MIAEQECEIRNWVISVYGLVTEWEATSTEKQERLNSRRLTRAAESDYFKCRDRHHAELRKHGISPV